MGDQNEPTNAGKSSISVSAALTMLEHPDPRIRAGFAAFLLRLEEPEAEASDDPDIYDMSPEELARAVEDLENQAAASAAKRRAGGEE